MFVNCDADLSWLEDLRELHADCNPSGNLLPIPLRRRYATFSTLPARLHITRPYSSLFILAVLHLLPPDFLRVSRTCSYDVFHASKHSQHACTLSRFPIFEPSGQAQLQGRDDQGRYSDNRGVGTGSKLRDTAEHEDTGNGNRHRNRPECVLYAKANVNTHGYIVVVKNDEVVA